MKKPKILIIADHPNWAYHHVAKFIISNLSQKYDFYLDFLMFNTNRKMKLIKSKVKVKIVSFFLFLESSAYRKRILCKKNYDIVLYLGYYFPFKGRFNFNSRGIIKGIFTDGFLPQCVESCDSDISMNDFVSKYLGDADSVVCGSMKILGRYDLYVKDIYYTSLDIDTYLFKHYGGKEINKSKTFIVGWTGNPRRKFKGFYGYVVPAVKKAASKREGIILKTRFEGPYKTLPQFYQNVDVVLIASIGDAGPAMFFEAAACEVPAIANNSGIPAEIIENGKNGLFVKRDIEKMVKAIVYLYDNREVLYKMSKQIRRDLINKISLDPMAKRWDKVFSETLERINISNI